MILTHRHLTVLCMKLTNPSPHAHTKEHHKPKSTEISSRPLASHTVPSQVLGLVSAILHLGNVEYVSTKEDAHLTIEAQSTVAIVAQLLG